MLHCDFIEKEKTKKFVLEIISSNLFDLPSSVQVSTKTLLFRKYIDKSTTTTTMMMMIKCVVFSWFRRIYKIVPFALGRFCDLPFCCFRFSFALSLFAGVWYIFLFIYLLCSMSFSLWMGNVCAIRCTCGARLILNVSFESYNTRKKAPREMERWNKLWRKEYASIYKSEREFL